MTGRKFFFFDIDGTLTDRTTNKIVPSAVTALERLRAAGHFVSIATGRAVYKAEAFRRENNFEHMVANGGHAIIYKNELRENRPLEYDKAKPVYDQARALGYGVLVATDDTKYVHSADFRFYEQVGLRREPTVYVIDPDFDPDDLGVIYKMYISIPKEEENRLTLLDTLGHMRFEPDYILFQPDEKLDGIIRMLDYAGGKPEDVVVFGDDVNDLVMFDDRFYKIAMGNGHPGLMAKADYVAPANVDDGILRACEEHGWI